MLNAVDEALRCFAAAIFSTPHILVENRQLSPLEGKELSHSPEATKCQSETGIVLLAACQVPSEVMEVLGVTRPQVPTTQVVETDENVNFVPREVESSQRFVMVSDSCLHGAVKFFEGVALEHRNPMKRELSSSDVRIGPVK